MTKLELLIKAIVAETGADNLTAETRFESLGLDSLDFLSLIKEVEKLFNCEIPDAEFVNLQTIGDLAERI